MVAIRENRQYTISDADVQGFVNDGYDVYDDNGNVIAYGIGKSVPYEKHMRLMAQVESLQDEIIELREQIKKLEKKKG